ncbi:MAG TPA: inosine-5-monophosphate dehydrogenase [Gammaproteobacteria bacterium]|nr:inosine-5-monophosphate dehydrogenase [Gammaproteobacteria bacterium]|tara:strand:+ start:47 stop:481 length:435 start_codon:yes stop_codon:yes gene_type:complete
MGERKIRDTLEGQQLVTAQSTMNVAQVAAMMKEDSIGAILVLNGDKLVGIFTERDALFRVVAEGLDAEKTTIAEVMTENPVTIGPDKFFTDALEIMYGGRHRHVPVVENGGPIGMVSSRDAMGPELEQFVYSKILQEQTFDVLA